MNYSILKPIVLSLFAIVLLSCSNSDPRIQLVDQFLHAEEEFYQFNGNVLVAEKGKIIYQHSFGYANFDTRAPLNDSSVFELASVSKQFTATAILLLQKDGKLSVGDSLRYFFPELPYHGITIHHLLTHTSGLPDYEELIPYHWDHKKIAFNKDMVALLASQKPAIYFKPGTRWQYSNTGFALLASIVEKVSGKSYNDFLLERIFQPLRMTHTRVYNSRRRGEVIPNYAYGFVWSDSLSRFMLPDSLKSFSYVYYMDGIVGDGTVNSTTGDLLKWDRAWRNATLLDTGTINSQLQYPHALADTASNMYYGYGVMVSKDTFGSLIQHSGGWPGYSTQLARYTDDDLTIIILSNNQSVSSGILLGLSHILHGRQVQMPAQLKVIPYDSTSLKHFSGSYKLRSTKFKLKTGPDHIQQVINPWVSRKLYPASADKLFAIDRLDFQIEHKKDGEKDRYYRTFYGVREELERTDR
ncbi:MAG: serine hydrolase domain-containing protein [Cyclobacteriaceae bacterium]